jgi:hypothetical protein
MRMKIDKISVIPKFLPKTSLVYASDNSPDSTQA